jgi:excisionase family DNA binding protein
VGVVPGTKEVIMSPPKIALALDVEALDLSVLAGRLLGDPLLTPEDLAKHLKVSARTIDTLIAEHQITCRYVGRQVRFRIADVLDYEERIKVRAAA